jgi:hypothetical protein
MKFSILKVSHINKSGLLSLAPLFVSRFLYAIPALISLPFLIKTVGSESWTTFVVAQVIGGGFGIFVEAQWKNTGIKKVVKASTESVSALVSSEFIKKTALLLITVVPMIVIIRVLIGNLSLDILLAAFSTSTASLSMELSLTSRKKFSTKLWVEPILRVVICVVGMYFFNGRDSVIHFFLLMIVGNFLLPLVTISPAVDFFGLIKLARFERNDLTYAIGRVVASSYTILPLVILSKLNIANLFTYALIDRLFRFTMTFYIPIFQLLQGNIHELKFGISEKWKRHLQIIGISSIIMTLLIIYVLQFIMFDLKLNIIILTIAGFSLQSAVINMNRYAEILLTEITASSSVQSRILYQSTLFFWAVFALVIWFQNYFVGIIACVLVEIFGLSLRLRLITEIESKKRLA